MWQTFTKSVKVKAVSTSNIIVCAFILGRKAIAKVSLKYIVMNFGNKLTVIKKPLSSNIILESTKEYSEM